MAQEECGNETFGTGNCKTLHPLKKGTGQPIFLVEEPDDDRPKDVLEEVCTADKVLEPESPQKNVKVRLHHMPSLLSFLQLTGLHTFAKPKSEQAL